VQDDLGADSTRTPATSTGGVSCNGDNIDNASQTDIVMGDIQFSAVQARNNPDFLCEAGDGGSCTGKADGMLVLDRSGSIDSGELAILKAAAISFVNSLALSPDGVHVGQTSFANSPSLDQHLTDSLVDAVSAISALSSGGFTNLSGGITTATAELANSGDGHDREDSESPDFMIIITDGRPNTPGTPEADAVVAADSARAAGIEVFVVGVGDDVDENYLRTQIADDNAHYFSALKFTDLSAVLKDIAICEVE